MFYLYSIFLNMLFFEINQEINVVMKFFSLYHIKQGAR